MLKFIHIIILFCALALASCTPRAEWRTVDGAVWGTTYHITYKSDRDLSAEILEAMQTIDNEVNVFNPRSAVSRYNAGETDTVSSVMACLVEASREVNSVSHGAFDPTVSPLIELWGFGKKKEIVTAPDSATIAECLAGVGIDKCTIKNDNVLTHMLARRPQFNFSAIAKGYGLDLVAEALADNGCKDYMVEIGGEVRVSGHNSRGEVWHVQIDAPEESGGHKRLEVVELPVSSPRGSGRNAVLCAMATSGNYRNFRRLADGTQIGHTISPVTGRPIKTDLLSATIIAPDCMTADALATACMAMSADSAAAMLRRWNATHAPVSARLVTHEGVKPLK